MTSITKRIFYLSFLVASRLYSQDIDLKLDTEVFADQSFYHKKYNLRKTGEIGGEGFELVKSSKLRHAFLGDMPLNPYYECGTWAISNGSIVLFIFDKKLVTKYGYKERESYRPIIISWDLRTDLRNSENKLLVLKNKLVVLNNALDPNELLDQLRAMIELKLDKLKAAASPDDPLYFLQLNENVENECYDLLYEKKLFASVETLKIYE